MSQGGRMHEPSASRAEARPPGVRAGPTTRLTGSYPVVTLSRLIGLTDHLGQNLRTVGREVAPSPSTSMSAVVATATLLSSLITYLVGSERSVSRSSSAVLLTATAQEASGGGNDNVITKDHGPPSA